LTESIQLPILLVNGTFSHSYSIGNIQVLNSSNEGNKQTASTNSICGVHIQPRKQRQSTKKQTTCSIHPARNQFIHQISKRRRTQRWSREKYRVQFIQQGINPSTKFQQEGELNDGLERNTEIFQSILVGK